MARCFCGCGRRLRFKGRIANVYGGNAQTLGEQVGALLDEEFATPAVLGELSEVDLRSVHADLEGFRDGYREVVHGDKRLAEMAELRAEYDPAPAPRPQGQREREAFGAREREQRHQHTERQARLDHRAALAKRPIFVPGFDEGVVLVLVSAIFRGSKIPDAHADTTDELRVALDRLEHLAPVRWHALRTLALSLKRGPRTHAYIRLCVEWLIAFTDAAHHEAETVIGEPVAPILDAPAAGPHAAEGTPERAPARSTSGVATLARADGP
jgi:hypothetical protein